MLTTRRLWLVAGLVAVAGAGAGIATALTTHEGASTSAPSAPQLAAASHPTAAPQPMSSNSASSPATPNTPSKAPAKKALPQPGMAHPWHTLTPRQQTVLAPMQSEWNKLSDINRSKWIKIADRYPRLSKDQQTRLQSRMREWVELTPYQRRIARENYQISKQLSAEKKAEAWQDYQQLTDAQKRKLEAASRANKPATAVSALPSGGGIVTDVRPPHRRSNQIDIDELLHSD
jgi:hypothetical protein